MSILSVIFNINVFNINVFNINLVYGTIILLLCSSAYSELKYLDEESLSQISAKAGLTIDIKTNYHIGELEYVDAGSMYWKDISFRGMGNGLRAKIDISDGSETLLTGFADVAMLAELGYLDANEEDVSWAINEYNTGAEYGKTHGDGDMLIHVTSVGYGMDFSSPPNASDFDSNLNASDFDSNLNAYKFSAGFEYKEGEFGIRSSDKQIETALSRNFSVEAYLGYFDILLKNNGNGFRPSSGLGEPEGIMLNDSYIGLDLKFRVEDLDIDHTNNATNRIIPHNMSRPYLVLRDMRIHNERGFDTLGSFGFASIESKIAAASGILGNYKRLLDSSKSPRVDGQAIYDINVKWDWDLPHISFGDTDISIGKIFITDFHIKDTSLVISAH